MFWNCSTESGNLERLIVAKLINIDIKMNSLERHQKLILDKLFINVDAAEKEDVDIFQFLSLKTEGDLQEVETKLSNDSTYRKEMVSYISVSINLMRIALYRVSQNWSTLGVYTTECYNPKVLFNLCVRACVRECVRAWLFIFYCYLETDTT